MDTMMQIDLPKLMEFIPRNTGSFNAKEEAMFTAPVANKTERFADREPEASSSASASAASNPFQKQNSVSAANNPFAKKKAQAIPWQIASEKARFDETFRSLGPVNGVVSGETAVECFTLSELPFEPDLAKIWELSDIDKDGNLDSEEFAVAMFLIEERVEGKDIPDALPLELVPPSKR
jgi:hypothetical protein